MERTRGKGLLQKKILTYCFSILFRLLYYVPKMTYKKIYTRTIFYSKKYFIFISVLFIILFVGIVAGYKLFFQKPTYLYIKVKVGQPLWWAISANPSIWYMHAMNKGDTSYDFFGQSEAQIIDKKTYLWSANDQYDIYLTMKIKVTENKRTKSYSFNRSTISVGAPIEFQFPRENVKGTVIEMNENKFKEILVEKTIYLEKPNAYLWEYEAIKPRGVSDGEKTVFTLLDKHIEETTQLTSDSIGNVMLNNTKTQGKVILKAKVKVRESNGVYVLGEDKIIEPGRPFDISLGDYVLKDFTISKIE